MVATSSSEEKRETVKRLGAKHVINYPTSPNWSGEVMSLTNGKGVDHVVEVGGAGAIEQSLRATMQGGLVSVVSILSQSKDVDIVPLLLYGGKTGMSCALNGLLTSTEEM